MKRFTSIDTTRGLVMIIMALDHVRDFMHTGSMSDSPTNLQTTTPLLFFTRWITHLCAPTFVFLAGTSAYISVKRQNNLAESRRFLLTRGLWLLLLEITLINLALWFDIHFRLMLMEVISAIGLSFIVLSFMLRLPSRLTGVIGILIVFSHNLFQGIPLPSNHFAVFISSVLFYPNLIPLPAGHSFFSAYPLVPWLGIMLTGFSCGELFDLAPEKRKKIFLTGGVGILSLFIILRFVDIYGDPSLWKTQKSAMFTFLSFLNVTKYPPSLLFSLLFIGIAFLLLFLTENRENRFTKICSTYGRVPLFFFIAHLYVIHLTMFIMLYIQGFHSGDFLFGPFKNGRPEHGGGVNLAVIYLLWIAIVILFFPLCQWFGNYRKMHPENKFLRYI